MNYTYPHIYSDRLANLLMQMNRIQLNINEQCASLLGIKHNQAFICSYDISDKVLYVGEQSYHLNPNSIIEIYMELVKETMEK